MVYRNLCTIILPSVKYCYRLLTMVISNSPDIFQQNMNDLSQGFYFIHAYTDDLLIITKVNCTDNVKKLKLTLSKLKGKGL